MTTQIQQKRGTAARWQTLNLILASGEVGLESDTGRRKTGDGSTPWNTLGYDFDQTVADARYPKKADVVPPGQVGAANGVASLDAGARVPQAQMPASYVPRWAPGVTYAVGDVVVAPTNEIATAKNAHTSGTTFSGTTNWTLGSSLNAKGLMLMQQGLANTTNYGGGNNVVASIPSFTFKAGRKYKIGWISEFQCSDATLYVYIGIFKVPVTDSASSNTGIGLQVAAEIESHTLTAKSANLTEFFEFETWYTPTVDETWQIKFATGGVAGAGTIFFLGRTGRPISYYIEDHGAQF